MSIIKLLIALSVGVAVGSGVTYINFKNTISKESSAALDVAHEKRLRFQTGKDYLDVCMPDSPSTYQSTEISSIVNVAAEGQACWSFMEATMDTLQAMGSRCKTLDNELKIEVMKTAKASNSERLSGAEAIGRAMFDSGACIK